MGFFRIFPSKDNWLTDAHPADNTSSTIGTGSNHGRSPSLNVFARKADINTSSIELARSLVQFDITELSGKVFDEGLIPTSSISYKFKMFNMLHADTVPESYDLFVFPVSQSWDEGSGIDDDNFRDFGFANWLSASSTTAWTITGSDFLATGFGSGSQRFDRLDEGLDLEVDITEVVGNWLSSSAGNGGLTNNGLVVKLGGSEETNAINYYRKAISCV